MDLKQNFDIILGPNDKNLLKPLPKE